MKVYRSKSVRLMKSHVAAIVSLTALAASSGALAQVPGTNASSGQATDQPSTTEAGSPAAASGANGAASNSAGATSNNVSDPNAIIVTARRRAENLERVPTAITAFGAQQLAERGIRTQSDLQLTVPGLTLRQTEGQNSLNYSIRGQTVDAFTGSPTAVVPYIDEVQLNTGGAASFFDLESIQVLKGPQGTLFGRNATGGAVLFTTAKPTNDLSGYAQFRVGNLALREGQGAINLPIIEDKILLRLSFDVASRDGYIHDLYHDTDLGRTRRQSGRVSLTVKPVEGITNSTVFEYDHSGGNNTGATYLYSVNQCGQTNNGFALNCAAAGLYNPAAFNAAFGPGAWDAYLAAHPNAYGPGLNAWLQEQKRLGYWVANTASLSSHHEHDYFVANTTTFDVAPDTQIKNILGKSYSYARDQAAETGDPFGIQFTDNLAANQYGNVVKTSQFSDELQLQGKTLGGNLQYIVGGYYQKTDTDIFYPQTYFDLRPFVPLSGPTTHWKTHDKTEAVYAQGTYDLSSAGLRGLSITGGIRYTWEQVSLVQLPDSNQYPGPNHQKISFQDPSWEAGIQYQANNDLMLYVKTRGSFRAGGLNGSAPPIFADASGGGDIFHSEHTHDVEAGLKYAGRVLDRPAHLNIAVYNQWISGVQRALFPTVTDVNGNSHSIAVTVNVPAAEVRGVEAEAAFRPVSWFELGASGAYTHARYTENRALLFGVNYVFGPYADTPKWSGTIYGQFTIPTDEHTGEMGLRAEAYGQTSQYFSNTDASFTPGTKLPGYTLVNLRYDWNKIMGTGLSASLFVKNLLKKGYFVGGLAEGISLGVNTADVGEPRTYGLELTYKF